MTTQELDDLVNSYHKAKPENRLKISQQILAETARREAQDAPKRKADMDKYWTAYKA